MNPDHQEVAHSDHNDRVYKRFSFRDILELFKRKSGEKQADVKVAQQVLEQSIETPDERALVEDDLALLCLYDEEIESLEQRAEQELAEVSGESLGFLLPDSAHGKIAYYNIGSTSGEFMLESEREQAESLVNTDHIIEAAKPAEEYLLQKVKEHDVVLLGEAHTMMVREKTFLLNTLRRLKDAGVTDLGIEVEEQHQVLVDHFRDHGVLNDSGDVINQALCEEWLELRHGIYSDDEEEFERSYRLQAEFEERFSDFDSFERFHEFFALLQLCRELGIRVTCIDADTRYGDGEVDKAIAEGRFTQLKEETTKKRDRTMKEKISAIVASGDRKMLVLLGSAHVASKGFSENLAELLEKDANIKNFRINIDRDLDGDVTVSKKKAHMKSALNYSVDFNSILYSSLNKSGKNEIGFDLDSSVLRSDSPELDLQFDGYIKI